jgi:hypothetical protein
MGSDSFLYYSIGILTDVFTASYKNVSQKEAFFKIFKIQKPRAARVLDK